jgi:hypothetical protein
MDTRTEISKRLGRELKLLGFKKNGNSWHGTEGGLSKILALQLSRFNTGDKVSFTLNLGVVDNDTHHLIWTSDHKPTPPITEADCFVRSRIGPLWLGRDYWWETTGQEGEDLAIIEAFLQVFNEFGKPFLNKFSTISDLLVYYEALPQGIMEKDFWLCQLHHASLKPVKEMVLGFMK